MLCNKSAEYTWKKVLTKVLSMHELTDTHNSAVLGTLPQVAVTLLELKLTFSQQ